MISDDDLLLYHYRDGLDSAERARIAAALSENSEIAQRLHTLVARLDAAAAALPEVPVPAEVQQRWQAALENAANNAGVSNATRVAPSRRYIPDFRWAAAAAVAVVALTFVIRATTHSTPEQPAVVAVPAPAASDSSAYDRGLKWHLASTERSLAKLDTTKPEDRKRLVESFISQNRMYALAADRAGEPKLARALRAFEPILESLAQDRSESSASAIAQLSFELRVLQGRLNAGADASTNTTTL
jgi:anti-sigma-K factor RskA